MVISPAPVQFCAVHLFPGSAGIAGGYNRIEFINDNRPKIPPEAGPLVSTPRGKIKEILVPVRSHWRRIWQRPVLKNHGLIR